MNTLVHGAFDQGKGILQRRSVKFHLHNNLDFINLFLPYFNQIMLIGHQLSNVPEKGRAEKHLMAQKTIFFHSGGGLFYY